MIFSFVKKKFFKLFLVYYFITNYKKIFHFFFSKNIFFDFEKKIPKYFFYNLICNIEQKKVKKKFFDKTKNHDVVYFTQMKNHRSENELKIIHYVQT